MSVIKRTTTIAATLFLFVGATCAQETAREKTGAISASIPPPSFVNRPSRLLAQLQHAEAAAVQPFEVASIKPSRADDNTRSLFMSPGKLVVAKGGPKLTETQVPPPSPDGTAAPNRGFRGIRMMGPSHLTGTNINIGLLANILSRQPELGRLVIDQTGLKGNYDWTLKWTPDQGVAMFKRPDGGQPSADVPAPDSSGPSIFTALEEQLGLKLESRKGPIETLVIDSIQRPSEN